jgi:hypothetical protein
VIRAKLSSGFREIAKQGLTDMIKLTRHSDCSATTGALWNAAASMATKCESITFSAETSMRPRWTGESGLRDPKK